MRGYLDHAASTPMRPEAVAAAEPYLRGHFANPSGAHAPARAARRALDEAREVVAGGLGVEPGSVVFTSGGTEADNLAVLGTHDALGGPLLCGATEHHAVLEPVQRRGGTTLAVGPDGRLDLEALEDRLVELDAAGTPPTLVSVMAVNNEVGVIAPLAEVANLVRRLAPDALLHTDAVQAVSWLDLRSVTEGYDLIAITGHKFGGPKGAGVLVVGPRAARRLTPRAHGGGQERGLRAGTPNVAGIAGLAAALAATLEGRAAEVARLRALRDHLLDGLTGSVPGLVLTTGTTAPETVVAGIAHMCVPGVESEALCYLLEERGVFVSAAASCSSGAMGSSHVLTAMDVAPELARGSVRFSLGWASTDADVDLALDAVPTAVAQLAPFAPSGPAAR